MPPSQWPNPRLPIYSYASRSATKTHSITGDTEESLDDTVTETFHPPSTPLPTPAENKRRWLGVTFTPGFFDGLHTISHNKTPAGSSHDGAFVNPGPYADYNSGLDPWFTYVAQSPTHLACKVSPGADDPVTKVRANKYLSQEYTTSHFVRDTLANFPDYELNWRLHDPNSDIPLADWNLVADQDDLSVGKCRYKFHIKGQKPASLTWFEEFVPDDPSLPPQFAMRTWTVPQNQDNFNSPFGSSTQRCEEQSPHRIFTMRIRPMDAIISYQ